MDIENTINNIVDRILNEELSEKKDKWIKGVDMKKQKMMEYEMTEGNAFVEARCKAICDGDKNFEVDGKTYPVKSADAKDKKSCGCKAIKESKKKSFTLTEEDMVELIQRLVIEQKEAKGLKDTERVLKGSKKVNDEAISAVNKKMKDYLKMGSKEEYTPDAKHFPKGNGELGEMEKHAYTPSDAVEEYITQIAQSGGMENLDYDSIKPDEDWIEMNLTGGSRTGNSSEYANAVKTDANEKVNDRRKKNWLSKLKKNSYKRVVQPVTDISGNKKSDGGAMSPDDVMNALSENVGEKNMNKVNEDILRMKSLLGHGYKSQ